MLVQQLECVSKPCRGNAEDDLLFVILFSLPFHIERIDDYLEYVFKPG